MSNEGIKKEIEIEEEIENRLEELRGKLGDMTNEEKEFPVMKARVGELEWVLGEIKMHCPKCGKKMKRTYAMGGYTYVCWNEDCPDYVGRPARDWSVKKMSKSKLELIIEDIAKRMVERFTEKSAKHRPGTEFDVASDNYNWDNDTLNYWHDDVIKHYSNWAYESNLGTLETEKMAIIDLMNVLVCRLHKLEVDAESHKKVQ